MKIKQKKKKEKTIRTYHFFSVYALANSLIMYYLLYKHIVITLNIGISELITIAFLTFEKIRLTIG